MAPRSPPGQGRPRKRGSSNRAPIGIVYDDHRVTMFRQHTWRCSRIAAAVRWHGLTAALLDAPPHARRGSGGRLPETSRRRADRVCAAEREGTTHGDLLGVRERGTVHHDGDVAWTDGRASAVPALRLVLPDSLPPIARRGLRRQRPLGSPREYRSTVCAPRASKAIGPLARIGAVAAAHPTRHPHLVRSAA
jgi:hypothetical protein